MASKIPSSSSNIVTRSMPAGRLASSLFASVSLTALVAVLACAGPTKAQTQSDPTRSDRAIELFTCKDVMRQPNTSREIAIAFLHGYLLGKSGKSKFNVEVLEDQTNKFIEECLDNPQSKAVDIMMKLK
jgi:hypothetical protein